MSILREVTTSHLRQNMGAVVTAVTSGETLRLVRGGHTVGYLVSPRDWNVMNASTVAEIAHDAGVKTLGVEGHVSAMIREAEWGIARTIAQAEGLESHEVLITPDARDEILRRIAAARATTPKPEEKDTRRD